MFADAFRWWYNLLPLTLEQVHATINYYLHNKEKVTAYLVNWLENTNRRWEEQNRNPSPAIQRLRSIVAERQVAPV